MEIHKDREGANEGTIEELRESLLKLEKQHTQDLETMREMERTIRQLKMENAKYKTKQAVIKIQAMYRSRLGRKRFEQLVDNLSSVAVEDAFAKYDVDEQSAYFSQSSTKKSELGGNSMNETKSETKDLYKLGGTQLQDKVGDDAFELPNLKNEEEVILSIFNIIDPGHNGFIPRRTFLHAIQLNENVQKLLSANPRLDRLQHSKSLRIEFQTMDENEDKMISMEEMLHYLTPRNKDENTDRGTSEIKNVVKNINALNDTGETQLDVAIKENNTKLIKILENNGGKTSNELSHDTYDEESSSHHFKHKSSKHEVQFSESDDDTLIQSSVGKEGMIDNNI